MKRVQVTRTPAGFKMVEAADGVLVSDRLFERWQEHQRKCAAMDAELEPLCPLVANRRKATNG